MENEKSPLLENEYSESLIDPNRGHSTNSCSYDFHILNKEFPDIFYKKQVYLNNQSIQRIDNGFLSFFLVFGSPEARNSVNCITVKVQHAFKQHKDVIIKHDQSFMDKNKVCIKIDLNSVYVVDNFKVFELDKNCNDDQRKSFFLDVEVKFSNNKTYKQSTQRFCLVGGKGRLNSSSSAAIVSPYSTPTQHYAEFGYSTSSREARCTQLSPLLQSDEFTTSCTSSREAIFSQLLSPLLQSDEFTTSCTSSRGAIFSQFSSPFLHLYEFTSSYATTCSDNDKILKCSNLVADHVQTKANQLEISFEGKIIPTSNGNVLYQWPLENEDDLFEEGEVVGFIADKVRKYNLRKLTLQNSTQAILKGVICRSFSLPAHISTDVRRSAIISMMGIVPVKVKGSVCINDALYASPDFPGFAVSRYHLDISLIQESAHIGYAISSHNAVDDDEEGMVKAGVSVLETASQCLLDVQLRTFKSRNDDIYIKQKLKKRYTWICFIVCIALAILSSVFLYQVFAPGTSYRYFLCKQGRLSGSAFFQYIPLQATSLYPQVRGIEFEFSVLMQKTDHPGYKRLNITGVRYYMNIDRCAYKSNTQSSNSVLTNPVTYGHDVFAVDKECYNAFYFKDEKWWRYDFVSWETKQNIFCHPPSTSKNFTWS